MCVVFACVCVFVHVTDSNRQPRKSRDRGVKRNLLCCLALFIYFPLSWHTNHTVSALSGADCAISLGGPNNPLQLAELWRKWEGRLLGDPNQSFFRRDWVSLPLPWVLSPPWLPESAFLSAAITFCHSKQHSHMCTRTCTHAHYHHSSDSSKSLLTGNLLTLHQESR